MKFMQTEKKQLLIYVIIAYGSVLKDRKAHGYTA